MGVRFIHTADWQIGMKGGGLGSAGAVVAEQRIESLRRIFEAAVERDAPLVLAAGDLFEHNDLSPETIERVAAVLSDFPDVAVHAIPGNHDLPGGGSVWRRVALREVSNLHVHDRAYGEAGPVDLGAMVLHPFPVHSRYAMDDPLEQLGDLSESPGIHVGLAHGHLTTVTFGAHEDEIKLPIGPEHVERSRLDYLALGHWHGRRVVATSDGAPRIAYSGTHEQTAWRERDAGYVLLVEIDGKGAPPRLTPIRTGALAWSTLTLAFAGDESLDRLRAALSETPADLLTLELDGELPGALREELGGLVEDERVRRREVRVHDESLRWRAAAAAAPFDIEDATLSAAWSRLEDELDGAADDEAAVLREAQGLLRRLVEEQVTS